MLITAHYSSPNGSAATPPQQEKTNPADMQRGSVHITGFMRAVESSFSLRSNFAEFEPRQRRRMYQNFRRKFGVFCRNSKGGLTEEDQQAPPPPPRTRTPQRSLEDFTDKSDQE
jgi:hypothetical protein